MDYYFDTCIWIDFFEDRKNLVGKNLGKPAYDAIFKITSHNNKIIISDIIHIELENVVDKNYLENELKILLMSGFLKTAYSTQEDRAYANKIASEKNVPFGDALNAILAKKNNATIITRDKHFKLLKEYAKSICPEEL
jgi:predicted nucleic acid-binding protein